MINSRKAKEDMGKKTEASPSRKPTLLEYALLGLTNQSAMSGYDLRKLFSTTPLGHFSNSPGAIYPALNRLKHRALLTAVVDTTTRLRPKQLFKPTADGVKQLRAWANSAVTTAQVIYNNDELLLRFAFMGQLSTIATTTRFLEDFRKGALSYVEELQAERKKFPVAAPIQAYLALDHGIKSYQANAAWASEALKTITDEASRINREKK
jgi:DNA-binding PadR family transcriptional regulator